MNKTLLLIICDFLLISILALVEIDAPAPPPPPETVTAEEATEAMRDDLVELLRLSLDEAAAEQAALQRDLERRETELAAREADLADTTEALTVTEAERAALAEARRQLEAERAQLAQTVELTQEELAAREAALAETAETLEQTEAERAALEAEATELTATVALTQEELAAREAREAEIAAALDEQRRTTAQLERMLAARDTALAEAETQAAELTAARDALAAATQRLETDLEVREAERTLLMQQVEQAEERIAVAQASQAQAQEQAARLAANLGELDATIAEQNEALAAQQAALQEEIRNVNPLSLNQIYTAYERNRVQLHFTGERGGNFGSRSIDERIPTLLVEQRGQVFAVFATENSPLRARDRDRLREMATRIELGSQTLRAGVVQLQAGQPGVALIPLPRDAVDRAGREVFRLAEDPLRFESVVITSTELGAYGELPTRVEPGGGALRVQREFLDQIFGDFRPRQGDFVFSRTGELIGLLVESERAVILATLSPGETLTF